MKHRSIYSLLLSAVLSMQVLEVCADSGVGSALDFSLNINDAAAIVLGVDSTARVLAASSIDSDIGGELEASVQGGPPHALASGLRSTASITLGPLIYSTTVTGGVSLSVSTGNVVSTAVGVSVSDEVVVGVISDSRLGKARLRISTGDIVSATSGVSGVGSVHIGSVSNAHEAVVDLEVHTGRIVNITTGFSRPNGHVRIGNIGK